MLDRLEDKLMLVDQDGGQVAADDIRLKDTLLAFEFGRHQRLNQIAFSPASSEAMNNEEGGAKKQQDASKDPDLKASKAQAKAILESNQNYIPLKLSMPALVHARSLETAVQKGEKTRKAALSQVEKLLAESEQLFFNTQGAGPELARHWFLSNMTEMLNELTAICDKLKTSPVVS